MEPEEGTLNAPRGTLHGLGGSLSTRADPRGGRRDFFTLTCAQYVMVFMAFISKVKAFVKKVAGEQYADRFNMTGSQMLMMDVKGMQRRCGGRW